MSLMGPQERGPKHSYFCAKRGAGLAAAPRGRSNNSWREAVADARAAGGGVRRGYAGWWGRGEGVGGDRTERGPSVRCVKGTAGFRALTHPSRAALDPHPPLTHPHPDPPQLLLAHLSLKSRGPMRWSYRPSLIGTLRLSKMMGVVTCTTLSLRTWNGGRAGGGRGEGRCTRGACIGGGWRAGGEGGRGGPALTCSIWDDGVGAQAGRG